MFLARVVWLPVTFRSHRQTSQTDKCKISIMMIDFKTSRRQLSLEDVQQFLESRGYIEEALDVGSTIDKMTVAIKT